MAGNNEPDLRVSYSCDFYDGEATSKECNKSGHPPDVYRKDDLSVDVPASSMSRATESFNHPKPEPHPHSGSIIERKIKGVTHCYLLDCDRLTWPFENYCSRKHADLGKRMGFPRMQHCTFRLVDHLTSEFSRVCQKFIGAWAVRPCPTVDFMFAVSNTSLEQKWLLYKCTLTDQTVEEHWHGTMLVCNIMANLRPCNYKNCGICGISRTGLNPNYIQKSPSFHRFGPGFYLAPNSSKCHDYTHCQGFSGYRAMLLCDVCAGTKYYLQRNQQHLSGPPSGYDSVYGVVGSSLNYPEIVIYNPDAVMPRYIVVYKDGIHNSLAGSRGFSGHILSRVELQVLNSLLSAYSNDKVKNVQISIQNKPNITREEVETMLLQNGMVTIASSLKENIEKGVENMKHYEAYEQALQSMLNLKMRYLKFLFLGPPRSGKTTMRQRLSQEIVNLKSLAEASRSTGMAETSDVFIKKLVSESAIIANLEWQSLKRSRKQGQNLYSPSEELGDNDYHRLAQFLYQLISKEQLADNSREQYYSNSHQATLPSKSSDGPDEDIFKYDRQNDSTAAQNTTDQAFTESKPCSNDSEIKEAFQRLTTILLSDNPEEFHQLLNQLIMINMVDVGGQPAFLEMLPMLTTGSALYFIFFRLDQELRKLYPVQFRDANNETEMLLESSYCTEDVIYQSLSSIACFGCYSSADKLESQVISRALLFGTYKDQIESAQISKLDKTLREKFLDTKLHAEGLLLRTSQNTVFFPIDNMNGDESEMSAIRRDIEGIIDAFFPAIPIPASWLMFRILLYLLRKPVVTLAQCEAVAHRLSMPTPVKEALWFFHHNVGSLMYYPDIPSMKDIVICDAQVIFDSISELIIDTFKISNRTIPTTAVDDFCNKGQFSLMHIKDRTEQQRGDGLTLLQLVDLLKHHNILAEIDQNSDCASQEPQFIIPAVLKCDPEENLKPQHLDTRTLMITFKCGFVPFGIFCAEIAHLISHQASMTPKWRCCDSDVKKNKVKFNIRGGYCTTLISRPQYFEIQVSKQHEESHCKLPITEVCFNVLQIIMETLETVISKMKYKPYAKIKTQLLPCERPFDIAFTCCLEKSHSDHLMKVIKDGDEWYAECSTTNNEVTLSKEQLAWFEMPSAQEAEYHNPGCMPHTIGESYYLNDGDHREIYVKLESHAAEWRDIGKSLGFSEQEMNTIQSNPILVIQGAPKSYLRELLTQYLQWGPGDQRGSKDFPTRDSLRIALQQTNLSQLASRL